ncbi:hypothetical protein SAMN04487943_101730 [Gracilibacillus orientalis]|uniref:Poly(Glycerol-phosphate) alpha-glucosyltransferase n=1 Tax=Gracilibacillus orientalis TaxID=334253 RepID=A0A1I4I040_9BACI|nr:hypothetical protein [Gracilibacillus orientalis]SFL47313.1 hypothetical protein SAMN04487943_101730 [Gracilibacillus orientalis]
MVKMKADVKEQYNLQMEKLHQFIQEKEDSLSQSEDTTLFLSIAHKSERATVLVEKNTSFSNAWEELHHKGQAYVQAKSIEQPLLKVDIVKNIKKENDVEFAEKLTKTKKNYFRYGISFDDQFQHAFLEQELNGNAIIRIDPKSKRGYIDERNLHFYIKKHRPQLKAINFSNVKSVYTFMTKGYIIEGENCYELHIDERENGRRSTPLDKQELEKLIEGGRDYLVHLSKQSGVFTYGYFSCFDKKINHYNTLRHASTLYSMCETYEFFPTQELRLAIIRSLQYLLNNCIGANQSDSEAFLLEKINDGIEVKLGGNAAAILAITKFTEVFEDDRHIAIAEKLAAGIGRMQNEEGSFVHVLNFPTLNVKDKYRIVYYDGEAALALMRLYQLTKSEKYLQMVKKAFEYFLANDYWKHHDHWLSYCTNELTIYCPEDQYFEFGLKNAEGRLNFIYHRITTFPTFLELTVAAYRMVDRIKEVGSDHLLANFDEQKLINTIHKRADYQRNGYFYPELAMYYKKPDRISGAFFIRHHSFRARIDDVEHNLSGYIEYYKTFQQHLISSDNLADATKNII